MQGVASGALPRYRGATPVPFYNTGQPTTGANPTKTFVQCASDVSILLTAAGGLLTAINAGLNALSENEIVVSAGVGYALGEISVAAFVATCLAAAPITIVLGAILAAGATAFAVYAVYNCMHGG